jgi:hypothetical protein
MKVYEAVAETLSRLGVDTTCWSAAGISVLSTT